MSEEKRRIMGIDLANEVVYHSKYGKGIVTSSDQKHLDVCFVSGRQSVFLFPSCFYRFLRLESPVLQSRVDLLVRQWRIDSGEIEREKLKIQYEETCSDVKARKQRAEEKRMQSVQRAAAFRTRARGNSVIIKGSR